METIIVPTESDFRKWIKEALVDYFEGNPLKINNMGGPEEDFLNRKQVAGIFGISLATLHVWMNKGLPCHKQRGRVYFLRSEVFEYVKEHKRISFETKDPGKYLSMKKYRETG
jgi:predicted DNA-binding transcriptional regulator AlpA